MLTLPPNTRVFVAVEPIDMRGSFDALAGHVRRLRADPLAGHLYLFLNRRRKLLKALWFDRSGWAIFSKRLERGSFELPTPSGDERKLAIDAAQLAMILEGIDLRARRRLRYHHPEPRRIDGPGSTTTPGPERTRGVSQLPDDWKEEFARLRAERDLAFREMAEMRKSLDQLARLMAGQNDRLDQVVSMLRRREAQLKRSEAENRKLRRKLGLDDPDPEPSAEPVPETDAPTSPDTSASSESPKSSGSKPKASSESDGGPKPRPRSRGGRRPPPEHLPVDVEDHEVCACGHCGGRVTRKEVLTTAVYDVVPSYVRRRVIRRERVVCIECNRPTTAPMPPMPCDRALYTCRFLAWLVVMKFVLHVPLDRIRELLLTQGVDIAMGTLVHLIARAADLCGPIDGEHMKQLNSAGALSNCNAHPRRKFRDTERAHPRLAVQGARFIQALYELEDEADLLGLAGIDRVAFRRRRSRRVLRRFRQWLDGVLDRPLPPSDPVRKVAQYYVNHFEDLTRFVNHAELPLDNNAAEREFQRHAKRLASLFAGSPEGGHRWAVLLGVVRTAQKCDLDVLDYLTWMFERRGSHRKQFATSAAELTPMAYRDQLAAAKRAA